MPGWNNRTARNKPRSRAVSPLLFVFAASVALAIVGPLAWRKYVSGPLLVWAGPVLIGIAAVLVGLVQRRVRGAAVLMVLFTAADLACYGMSYSVYGRTADLHDYVAATALPPAGTGSRVIAPNRKPGLRTGDRMLLAGVGRVDGYAGLEPARRLDYRNPRTWQLAGVAWAWQPDNESSEPRRRWVPVAPTAPRARLITQTTTEPLDEAAQVDWHSSTVDPPLTLPESTPGQCRVERDRPGRITIETNAPARQLLATTESFDPGWTVYIDGRRGRVVRVDGDFLGLRGRVW